MGAGCSKYRGIEIPGESMLVHQNTDFELENEDENGDNLSFQELSRENELNSLLNRFRHNEITALQKHYRMAIVNAAEMISKLEKLDLSKGDVDNISVPRGRKTSIGKLSSSNRRTYPKETSQTRKQLSRSKGEFGLGGLKISFPDIKKLPEHVQTNVIASFNSKYSEDIGNGKAPEEQSVSFKDFCRALSLCIRGTKYERLRFVFDLFAMPGVHRFYGQGDPRYTQTPSDSVISFDDFKLLMLHISTVKTSASDVPLQEPGIEIDAQFPESSSISLLQFFEWADLHISSEILDEVLAPFSLLPRREQELDIVLEHLLKTPRYAAGDIVCLIEINWWKKWMLYVNIHEKIDKIGILVASALGMSMGDFIVVEENPPKRPYQIENDELQGNEDWSVRDDLIEGVHFVTVPKIVWDFLIGWYSGGPYFSRKVIEGGTESSQASVRYTSGTSLDLYLCSFQVALCGADGQLTTINGKQVFVSRNALLYQLLGASLEALSYGKNSELDDKIDYTKIENEKDLFNFARLWVLVETNEFVGTSKVPIPDKNSNKNYAMSSQQRVKRWNLLSSKSSSVPILELGLKNGAFLILEMELIGSENEKRFWPRQAHVEPEGFRSFQIGDNLDILDKQGIWRSGTVTRLEDRSDLIDPIEKDLNKDEMSVQSSMQQICISMLDKNPRKGPKMGKGESEFTHEWLNVDSVRIAPYKSKVQVHSVALKKSEEFVTVQSRGVSLKRPMSLSSIGLSSNTSHDGLSNPSRFSILSRSLGGRNLRSSTEIKSVAVTPEYQSLPSMVKDNRPMSLFGPWPVTGMSNFAGLPLNRHTSTAGVPPVQGACGLVNMGNSCYLNSALQCLSHTPMFRGYMVGGMQSAEINVSNVLGTQGKLVEELAYLLQQLWSGDYLCVLPIKFKRTLAHFKSQFAGMEQQDGQEFLTVILDALHEDLNRVVYKPYVSPLDDAALSSMSDPQIAAEAWKRHLLRNRSLIVDLFQGQLKMECKCESCGKASSNFDPFMFLSVPIPARDDKNFTVLFVPRVLGRKSKGSQKYLMRFCFTLPRLSQVSSIVDLLAESLELPASTIELTDVYRAQVVKIFEKDAPLALIRDDDFLVAYEKSWCPVSKDLDTENQLFFSGKMSPPPIIRISKKATIDINKEFDEFTDVDDDPEEADPSPVPSTANNSNVSSFPLVFGGICIGMKLDALDHRGAWYGGIICADEGLGEQRRVRVHFDDFESRWDEWYNSRSFFEGKLAPYMTKSSVSGQGQLRWITAMHVRHTAYGRSIIQRKPQKPDEENSGKNNASSKTSEQPLKEVFGLPILLHCARNRSLRWLWRQTIRQASQFLLGPAPENLIDAMHELGLQNIGEDISLSEAAIVITGAVPKNSTSTKQSQDDAGVLDVLLLRELPFKVAIVNIHAPLSTRFDRHLMPNYHVSIKDGMPSKSALALVWEPEGYLLNYRDPFLNCIDDKSYTDLQNVEVGEHKKLNLSDCLEQFIDEDILDSWYCSRCEKHTRAKVKIQLWKTPDILVIHMKRFHHSSRYREKLRALVNFPRMGLDLKPFVCSNNMGMNAGGSVMSGVQATDDSDFLYDLYSVVNHMGGLSGGHYTASCLSTFCSPDGIEDIISSGQSQEDSKSSKWFYFDDEFVEELPTSKIVTEAAYVLFYKRRRLTASNIVNTTI